MTKSTAKTAASFQEDFELSLKRLETDYVDLLYIHSLGSIEDVDNRKKNGVFDKAQELQAKGQVRYLGVSCHTHATVARYFLENLRDNLFVSCFQTPVNSVDAGSPGNSFTTQVIPQVIGNGLSHIAMKSLAGGALAGQKLASRNVKVERYPIPGDISLDYRFGERHGNRGSGKVQCRGSQKLCQSLGSGQGPDHRQSGGSGILPGLQNRDL